MKQITLERANGVQVAKIGSFGNGKTHSVQGWAAHKNVNLRTEREIIQYARDNKLTVKFGR